MRKELIELDKINEEHNGCTINYKLYVKMTLHALELNEKGIKSKKIKIDKVYYKMTEDELIPKVQWWRFW